jgi:hypothetical protein
MRQDVVDSADALTMLAAVPPASRFSPGLFSSKGSAGAPTLLVPSTGRLAHPGR